MSIKFVYKAFDAGGRPVTNTLEAPTKEKALELIEALKKEGLTDIVIESASAINPAAAGGARAPSGTSIVAIVLCLVVFAALFWAAGVCRVFYGGDIGFRAVYKRSFSFKDTIVNLDDLIGQPYILLMSQHPAAMRQLDEMGIIKNPARSLAESVENGAEEAKTLAARADILSNIAIALKLYELDKGAYPSNDDGLKVLVGPYLEKHPIDPWGRAYQYAYPGQQNAKSYDLFSMGPDGLASTPDDVYNWKQ